MKNKRNVAVVSALLAAMMLAGSVSAVHPLTNASFAWETEDTTEVVEVEEVVEVADVEVVETEAETVEVEAENVEFELAMLNGALREYFGLAEGEALTTELLAGVHSIRFERSVFDGNLPAEYEGKTAVKCIINEGLLPGVEVAEAPVDEALIAYEVMPTTVRAKYFDLSAVTDEWLNMKLNAFYVIKDANDPSLEPEGVADMKQLFPNVAVDAIAVLDPYAKDRELAELANIFAEYELLALDTLIDGVEIVITKEDAMKLPSEFTVSSSEDLTLTLN